MLRLIHDEVKNCGNFLVFLFQLSFSENISVKWKL